MSTPEQRSIRLPNRIDAALYVLGVLPAVFTFLPYYQRRATGTVQGQPFPAVTTTFDGWHGVFGWLGAVVALVAALLVAGVQLSPLRDRGLTPRTAAAGLFALAAGCLVLAGFVLPSVVQVSVLVREQIALSGVDLAVRYSRGIGFWLSLACVVIGLLVAGLRRTTDVTVEADEANEADVDDTAHVSDE